jgi:hypothetical protein
MRSKPSGLLDDPERVRQREGEVNMSTPKEEVRKMLDRLPDDSSFEDIQYHIYVREKIERGLKDVAEGRVLSQEEMERRMCALTKKWL